MHRDTDINAKLVTHLNALNVFFSIKIGACFYREKVIAGKGYKLSAVFFSVEKYFLYIPSLLYRYYRSFVYNN